MSELCEADIEDVGEIIELNEKQAKIYEKFQNIKSVFSSYNYSMKGNGSLVEFDIFQALNEINILSNQIMVIRDEKTHHGLIFLKENYIELDKVADIINSLSVDDVVNLTKEFVNTGLWSFGELGNINSKDNKKAYDKFSKELFKEGK